MRGVGSLLLVACLVLVAGADEPEPVYGVGVGDVLTVTAFQHEEITGRFQVAEDGTITYPLIGQVHVAGRTVAEVSALLERLLERDYFVDVQLHVEVGEYRSHPVTVFGEVRSPGTFYLRGRTVLTDIIAEAGGLGAAAGPEIELRRKVGPEGEEPEVITLSTTKVMTGEQGHDIVLRDGDVISVGQRQLYFITGEVSRPGQYEIMRGMTLMQALSQAGGQSKFASQDVEIHRDSDGEKTITSYDLGAIRKGREGDPPIKAGDVIIVRRRFF
jgi:polysaccharide export outer membrane protein